MTQSVSVCGPSHDLRVRLPAPPFASQWLLRVYDVFGSLLVASCELSHLILIECHEVGIIILPIIPRRIWGMEGIPTH